MKTKIYQSLYNELWYDSEKKEIVNSYSESTSEMSEESYLSCLSTITDIMEKLEGVTYMIVDYHQFNYPITPEQQTKAVLLVTSRWIKMGLQKLAAIMPTEFIANLSVDQMASDARRIALYSIEYFDTYEKARNWFYNS